MPCVQRALNGLLTAHVVTKMFVPLALLVSVSSVMIVVAVFANPNPTSFLSPGSAFPPFFICFNYVFSFFCCNLLSGYSLLVGFRLFALFIGLSVGLIGVF